MHATKPWFAPKPYGFGAAFPIAWQGWLTLWLFVIGMALAVTQLRGLWMMAAITGGIVAFVLVAANKTAGGWRWRRGANEP